MVNGHCCPSGTRQDGSGACCNNDASYKIYKDVSRRVVDQTDYKRVVRGLMNAMSA